MSIYIHKDGRQSGPFDEQTIVEQLRSGKLSAEDLGIREGQSDWQKLGVMFPSAVSAPAAFSPPPPPVPVQTAATTAEPVQYEAVYRGTTLQKVFFGLCLLVAAAAFAGAAFYFYSMLGSSGDLQADLSRLSYRLLWRNAAGGILVGAFFTLLAFILTFKRKLIRSNGPRVALRVFFILILAAGAVCMAGAAASYLLYTPEVSSSSSSKQSNELLRALEEGSAAVAPYESAVILLPIGGGLFLLGLSGILMTKKLRTE